MNYNSLYEIGLVVSVIISLVIIISLCVDIRYIKLDNIKINTTITTISLLCLVIAAFCYKNIKKSYNEVYYLECTIYYPDNTYKLKVDSCNHIHYQSDRGTNHIRYYSIPKKTTYGIDTTAPILINKIIKK